jgi:hypothetical protein
MPWKETWASGAEEALRCSDLECIAAEGAARTVAAKGCKTGDELDVEDDKWDVTPVSVCFAEVDVEEEEWDVDPDALILDVLEVEDDDGIDVDDGACRVDFGDAAAAETTIVGDEAFEGTDPFVHDSALCIDDDDEEVLWEVEGEEEEEEEDDDDVAEVEEPFRDNDILLVSAWWSWHIWGAPTGCVEEDDDEEIDATVEDDIDGGDEDEFDGGGFDNNGLMDACGVVVVLEIDSHSLRGFREPSSKKSM